MLNPGKVAEVAVAVAGCQQDYEAGRTQTYAQARARIRKRLTKHRMQGARYLGRSRHSAGVHPVHLRKAR
jgi:hypothetical protein